MYFTLEAFNPHKDLNSSEWENLEKTRRQKQVEWMYQIFKPKKGKP
jgi:hypothetical protein